MLGDPIPVEATVMLCALVVCVATAVLLVSWTLQHAAKAWKCLRSHLADALEAAANIIRPAPAAARRHHHRARKQQACCHNPEVKPPTGQQSNAQPPKEASSQHKQHSPALKRKHKNRKQRAKPPKQTPPAQGRQAPAAAQQPAKRQPSKGQRQPAVAAQQPAQRQPSKADASGQLAQASKSKRRRGKKGKGKSSTPMQPEPAQPLQTLTARTAGNASASTPITVQQLASSLVINAIMGFAWRSKAPTLPSRKPRLQPDSNNSTARQLSFTPGPKPPQQTAGQQCCCGAGCFGAQLELPPPVVSRSGEWACTVVQRKRVNGKLLAFVRWDPTWVPWEEVNEAAQEDFCRKRGVGSCLVATSLDPPKTQARHSRFPVSQQAACCNSIFGLRNHSNPTFQLAQRT